MQLFSSVLRNQAVNSPLHQIKEMQRFMKSELTEVTDVVGENLPLCRSVHHKLDKK
jgi:hypothetical protein